MTRELIRQSDLINQLVLDRATLEELGRVELLWMYPQSHRVLGFICKSGFLGSQKSAFQLRQIGSLGASGLLTQNQPEKTTAERVRRLESLLDHEIWSEDGNRIGKITDCLFQLQTGEITQYLFVSSGWTGVLGELYQLSPSQILSFGKQRVLVLATAEFELYQSGLSQKLSQKLSQQAEATTEQAKEQFQQLQQLTEQAKVKAQQLSQQLTQKAQVLKTQVSETTQTILEQVESGFETLSTQVEEAFESIEGSDRSDRLAYRSSQRLSDELDHELDDEFDDEFDNEFDDELNSEREAGSAQPTLRTVSPAHSAPSLKLESDASLDDDIWGDDWDLDEKTNVDLKNTDIKNTEVNQSLPRATSQSTQSPPSPGSPGLGRTDTANSVTPLERADLEDDDEPWI